MLDDVRAGVVSIDEPLVSLLLACGDHIGALVDAVEASPQGASPDLLSRGKPLVSRLRAYLTPAQPDDAASVRAASASGCCADGQALPGASDLWHISIRFGADVLRNGMDPLSFIRYLRTLGTVVGVVTCATQMPEAEAMDPEACHLGFEIALRTQADKAAIESVFDFVLDDCTLSILPPTSLSADYVALLHALPAESDRIGEMLVRCGAITARELDAALARQSQAKAADEARACRNLPVQCGVDLRGQACNDRQAEQHQLRRLLVLGPARRRLDVVAVDALLQHRPDPRRAPGTRPP